MAVLKGAADLTGELACTSLPQSSMRDDVVQHLSAVHVLLNEVVVMLRDCDRVSVVARGGRG